MVFILREVGVDSSTQDNSKREKASVQTWLYVKQPLAYRSNCYGIEPLCTACKTGLGGWEMPNQLVLFNMKHGLLNAVVCQHPCKSKCGLHNTYSVFSVRFTYLLWNCCHLKEVGIDKIGIRAEIRRRCQESSHKLSICTIAIRCVCN